MADLKHPSSDQPVNPKSNPDHGRGKNKVDDALPPTTTEEEERRRDTGAREGGKR